MSRYMNRSTIAAAGLGLAFIAGCVPTAESPAPVPVEPPYTVRRPVETATPPAVAPRTVATDEPEVSWETDRDRTFARFLRDHSAGMIRKAAVGIEDRGRLRVEVSRAVAPEDTLELTKSLMAGARKDFPGKPITLSLYSPDGGRILDAKYRPGHGVSYHIAHGGPPSEAQAETSRGRPESKAPAPPLGDPLARSGVTESDRRFATWAEEHGRAYLRYVQADLETHGRLWFGVTRDVKPADVPRLTKSLLEGAQKEFPRRGLIATVFDPEGERIGRAHLAADGTVRWEH